MTTSIKSTSSTETPSGQQPVAEWRRHQDYPGGAWQVTNGKVFLSFDQYRQLRSLSSLGAQPTGLFDQLKAAVATVAVNYAHLGRVRKGSAQQAVLTDVVAQALNASFRYQP